MPDRIARVWNGTSWEVITSTAAAANAVAVYQSASPSGPVTGLVWIDSDDKTPYVYTGSAWESFPDLSSYATISSLSSYAPLSSPSLTGTPTSPTATVGTNTTQIATTAFVNTEISNDAVTKVTYTAKGDILTASASGAPLILSVGTNGQVLTASSTATGGLVWAPATAGATGGGTDQVFYNNDQTVTTNYSIPSGKNSMSAGPITINNSVTVTIPSGSVWSII